MTNINQPDSNESVLKQLRSLMPSRQLTFGEALQVAERQANGLLDLALRLTSRDRVRVLSSII